MKSKENIFSSQKFMIEEGKQGSTHFPCTGMKPGVFSIAALQKEDVGLEN